MKRSSSTSDPFGFLVAHGPIGDATSFAAWVQAMVDVEVALLVATAPPHADVAERLSRCVDDGSLDLDALARDAPLGGNLAIPLVGQLRALAGPEVAPFVHRGATSQDVVDTATMSVTRSSLAVIDEALARAGESVNWLSDEHGATPMIARTLLQHAVPTTFATVTSRWASGLAAARRAVGDIVERLPVQLCGPAGDGLPYTDEVTAAVADRLGLAVPAAPWSGDRTIVAALAGVLGTVAAACAKVALDVVLLAQSDVGELAEVADGAGGSSSMAHKHNPIAAVSARASALQAPGLVATLLHAAGAGELERAAGAWHAEWPATCQLLRATGSAAFWLATSIERLQVDSQRMADNLQRATEATR